MAVLPARICMNISSVHSVFIERGRRLARPSPRSSAIASPELVPGRTLPLIGAAVYRLYRWTMTGPPTSRTFASVPSGTISPLTLRTWSRLMSSTR